MSAQDNSAGTEGEELTNNEGTTGETLPADEVFHLLQNARRRKVLRHVFEHEDEESFEMRDIAEQVAAWENDTTIQQLTSNERQRAYISLYQCHLPKLDEKGVIDYNQSRGIVKPTSAVEQFRSYVETEVGETPDEAASETDSPADDTNRYYGTATVVSVLLTAVSWFGMAPTVLSSYLSFFITGLFALVTVGVMRQRYLSVR